MSTERSVHHTDSGTEFVVWPLDRGVYFDPTGMTCEVHLIEDATGTVYTQTGEVFTDTDSRVKVRWVSTADFFLNKTGRWRYRGKFDTWTNHESERFTVVDWT